MLSKSEPNEQEYQAWSPSIPQQQQQQKRPPLVIGFCGYGESGKDTAAFAIVDHTKSAKPESNPAYALAFADGIRDVVWTFDPWLGSERYRTSLVRRALIIDPFFPVALGLNDVGNFHPDALLPVLALLAYQKYPRFTDLGYDHVLYQAYERCKRENPAIREALVSMGQAIRSTIGEGSWVNAIRERLPRILEDHAEVIFKDARQLNEVKFITEELNGVVVYIDNPNKGPKDETEARTISEILAEYGREGDARRRFIKVTNDGTLDQFKDKILRFYRAFLCGCDLCELHEFNASASRDVTRI